MLHVLEIMVNKNQRGIDHRRMLITDGNLQVVSDYRMGFDWLWIVLVVALGAALVFPLIYGYPRVNIPRQPETEGFDDAALGKGYCEIMERLEFKSMRNVVVKKLIKILDNDKKEGEIDILDLGCGTGHLIKDFHDKLVKSGWRVKMHGIDIGFASILQCKEYLRKVGMENADIKEGDGARMPLDNVSMDVVVTSLSLHHWSRPADILAEIYRVLKPGGLFLLFDLRRDARKFFHHAFKHWFTPRMPEPLKSAGDPYRSMLAAYTNNEIKSMMMVSPWKDSGFEINPQSFSIFVHAKKG